nr:hypothetical protein [Tanacetum cinerariifolium]
YAKCMDLLLLNEYETYGFHPNECVFIQRRVINELVDFNGETEIPRYMKFFKLQQISKARCFINVMRNEAQQSRNRLAKLNAMISEMEAMDDP